MREGNAPRVLAVLNSFLLALLDFAGVTNVPKQMRLFDARPWLAVRLVFGSLLTFLRSSHVAFILFFSYTVYW